MKLSNKFYYNYFINMVTLKNVVFDTKKKTFLSNLKNFEHTKIAQNYFFVFQKVSEW